MIKIMFQLIIGILVSKAVKATSTKDALLEVKYEFKSYRKQLFFLFRVFVLIFLVAEENLDQ